MRVVRLDGKLIEDKATFLAAVAEALQFPDYFGMNWDAFWDCLWDVEEPTHLISEESAPGTRWRTREGYDIALRMFREAPAPLNITLR